MTGGPDVSAHSEVAGVPRYLPALDGLRIFSAAGVVIFHAFVQREILLDYGHPLRNEIAGLGFACVDVFFSLSGFLITKLLLDEKVSSGRVDLKAFYVRRTLRIWPVYYVALLIGFGGAAIFRDAYCRPFGSSFSGDLFRVALPAYAVFVGNWIHVSVPSSIDILWSVCIEEQFYLIFPLTFIFARRRHPVLLPAALGIVMSCSVRAWLAAAGHVASIPYNTAAHADNLLIGALLAQWIHSDHRRVLHAFKRWGMAGEVVGIAGFLAYTQWIGAGSHSVVGWTLLYLVGGLETTLLVGVFAFGEGPIKSFLCRKFIRFLGQLTYATYVFHRYPLVLVWVTIRLVPLGPWSAGSLRAALAIPLALLVAWISRVTIELRFLRLKDRFEPRELGPSQPVLTVSEGVVQEA